MSLKKKAISSIIWSSIQQFSSQGIGFVISITLARLLLPAEFGLIAILGVFISIGTALINGGLTQSLIRSKELDNEDYSTVFYFNIIGSLFIYMLLYTLAPFISKFYGYSELSLVVRVYGTTVIISAVSAVQSARFLKSMDFKTILKVTFPSIVLGGFVGITMAYSGYGVWSLVYSAITQSAASTIQLWYWSKWKPSWVFNKIKFKYHFNFGLKLMISGVLDVIFINIYTLIIGKFFAQAQVGFYDRANTLRMLPVNNIGSIVTRVTFPLFSSIQDDDVRLKHMYRKIMQMVIYLVAPTLIFMAVLAEPLFVVIFTAKWLPAVPYFQILCVSGILYPIHSYNLQILTVKGLSGLFLKLEMIKKVLIICVITISIQFGINGLLYGSVFTSFVGFFINTHYSGKLLKYNAISQLKDLLPIIFLALCIGGLVFYFDLLLHNLEYTNIVRLIFGGALGISLYIFTSYLLRINSLYEIISIVKRK